MNEPRVSIIVPIYNVEAYLSKCLDSLVRQTYKNIEIVCVNDGSSDGSRKILSEYKLKDQRVKIIDQNNQGLSGARNSGLKTASGEYVMFVDSDDWIDHETVAVAIKNAEEHRADVVFWCYAKEYESSSQEKHFLWEDGHYFDKKEVAEKLYRRLCGLLDEELMHPEYANAIETAWGKLYRKEVLSGIEFIDTRIIGTEDCLYNLYVFSKVRSAVYLDRAYYHYRKNNQSSLTSNYKADLYSRWQNLFTMMEEHIKRQRLPAHYMVAWNNRVALSIIGLGLNQCASGLGFRDNRKRIHSIVMSDRYRQAYRYLIMQYFPMHWKVFFYSCKKGYSGLTLILLKIMSRLA